MPLLLLLPLLAAPADDLHDRARELLDEDDPAAAAELLHARLLRDADDTRAAELYGRALAALERQDEAAHWLEQAALAHARAGRGREARRVERLLDRNDPVADRRARLLAGLVRDLSRAAQRLEDSGQLQRALELYSRLRPLARDDEWEAIVEAIERIRNVDAEVDLDASADADGEPGSWSVLTVETEHYDLVCNLEPEVVDQLAVTVEDIFSAFVEIYFDGDIGRAPSRRVTVRVHATWDDMADHYPGEIPSTGIGGWWSPGSAQIHLYDTRTRGGSLDAMLVTLVHEGSHQFMSTFARGGTPAWINEGTACFFEGVTAMADGRVLWPVAARGRLLALATDLSAEPRRGPRVREVLAYPGPGSFPGNYYHHGWGLVYFLQQWEDPETLEYAYRPHYLELIDRYTGRGGAGGLPIFEEVVLGRDSPLGHETMDEFIADWERWILERVLPLHQGPRPERRARRMARAERYLAAAEGEDERWEDVEIGEEDLLMRALGELQVVREDLDGDTPRRDVLERMARVLERLDREKTAATMVEALLDGADEGAIELTEEEYEAYERRLEELDRKNFALRTVRARGRSHARRILKLVERYRERHPELLLRAYTLAATAAEVLEEGGELAARAAELRRRADEAGRLMGRVLTASPSKDAWETVFSTAPSSFEVEAGAVTLSSVRPCGMIDTGLSARAAYEVRGRLVRSEERHLGTAHGLVVAGTASTDWQVVGIDDEGHVSLWEVRHGDGGTTRVKYLETLYLDEPVAVEDTPVLALRVTEDGRLSVRVDDRPPVEAFLPTPTGTTHVGVFVRDGELRVEGLAVEVFP